MNREQDNQNMSLDDWISDLLLSEPVDQDREALKAIIATWEENVAVCLSIEHVICKNCGFETLSPTGEFLLKAYHTKKKYYHYTAINSPEAYSNLPRERTVHTKRVPACHECFGLPSTSAAPLSKPNGAGAGASSKEDHDHELH